MVKLVIVGFLVLTVVIMIACVLYNEWWMRDVDKRIEKTRAMLKEAIESSEGFDDVSK